MKRLARIFQSKPSEVVADALAQGTGSTDLADDACRFRFGKRSGSAHRHQVSLRLQQTTGYSQSSVHSQFLLQFYPTGIIDLQFRLSANHQGTAPADELPFKRKVEGAEQGNWPDCNRSSLPEAPSGRFGWRVAGVDHYPLKIGAFPAGSSGCPRFPDWYCLP